MGTSPSTDLSFRHRRLAPKKTSRMKYWEITDNLSKHGWSWGSVPTLDCEGRTIWIVDAHRDDGKRFVAHADEKLTAFIELEAAIRSRGEFVLTT
jgi:hypothetical protein